MLNVKHYITSHFVKSFLTIFLPFFLIISLVYLVKISSLTSKIQITFLEILQLYSYSIPDIVFYTLPLSFITALANILIKLSQDNELIALYALGLNANYILRRLLLLGILFSLLLASISFLAMPLSKQLYKSFKEDKKYQAKLNIIPGELGQKFGNYYIYVKDKDENNNLFHDMVIYNRSNQKNEQFFSAKTGQLKNTSHTTSLILHDGYGYTYSDTKLQQAQYKSLEIFDSVDKKPYRFENIIDHWAMAKTDAKRMHRLLFFTFVSFIPLLALYMVASFTMINPRYQKNYTFVVVILVSLLLYMIASGLEKWGTPLTLVLSITMTFMLGFLLFKRRVLKYF